MTLAHSLSADQAILLFTLGIALIYVELNRPGWIIPGALGLLATLLALAAMVQNGINLAAAMLALTLGLARLNPRIHAAISVPCGLLLGAGTSLLTRIAHRARVNKGLD